MPFQNVTLHGVERNFEQVLSSIFARLAPIIKIEDLVPDSDGWTIKDDLAALETMVGDSSDKLWSAAIDADGNSRAGLLEEQVKAQGLELGRVAEQLSSLQVAHRSITEHLADMISGPPNAARIGAEISAMSIAETVHPVGVLMNGAPQYFVETAPGVLDQVHVGPDGITDAQRAIDPNPAHWAGDPDTDQIGSSTDDRGDSRV